MSAASPRAIGGRYVVHDELAAGGMATVHLGRLLGAAGFSRSVAIKRLHPQFAKDADFVSMFIDEARIAARIRHPNVVATLDTLSVDGELFLVMELVLGETLAGLVRASSPVPVDVAVAIVHGALHGLHAAHEATDERGTCLQIVHRDVSPQNMMIGVDGLTRVLDFGVAKALGRLQTTRDGQVKGKIAYMSPEQLRGGRVDRRTDVYAAAVVLWEVLAGRRLFIADDPGEIVVRVLEQPIEPPSRYAPGVPPALDDIVMRGLRRDPSLRFDTAEEMAIALEQVIALPTQTRIARWVAEAGGDRITQRAQLIARIDSESHQTGTAEASPAQPNEVLSEAVTAIRDAGDPPRRARARRSWWIAAAAAVVVITGGVSVRACVRADRTIAASADPPTSPAVAPAPVAPAPIAPDPIAPAPATPAVGSRAGAPVRPVSAKKRTGTAGPTKKKPSCNPPYTVDADGVHIPKKECR